MRIQVSVVLRLLQYVAIGLATGVVTLLTLSVPNSPGVKAPSHLLVIVCAVVIGVGGFAEGFFKTLSEAIGGISFSRRQLVDDTLKALLVSLADTTKIPWTEIGLTTFIVRWRMRHPFGLVQVRVARLRMKSTPRPTAILWTKDKGVLGRCWRNRRDEELDHQSKYGSYMSYSKDEWQELGQDVREGLSYDDFVAIRDFGYVLATPIVDGKSRYRGCLLVQVASEYASRLAAGSKARELLHLSADTVAGLLFGA